MTTKELIAALKPKLAEYLLLFDRDASKGNFRCLMPERHAHGDDKASMGIVPQSNGQVAHCFTCSLSVDIFSAAHILEGLPIDGVRFYKETLPHLAQLFGYKYSEKEQEYSEQEKRTFSIYRAYKDMETYVVNNLESNQLALDELERRKWNIETCKKLGIGASKSYSDYISYMTSIGWTETFLKARDVDLYRKELFGDNKLIFVIHDEYNNTIGVASRVLGEYRDSKKVEKYINTRNNNIYKKHEILYNINNIVKGSSIYLVEGYADVVTAIHNNLYNFVATGGVAVSKEHFELLNRKNISEVTIALDNDTAGVNGTKKVIDIISKINFVPQVFLINYKELPSEFKDIGEEEFKSLNDPDEMIRKYGSTFFTSLKKETPFKWQLINMPYNYDKESFIDNIFGTIMNENSPMKRKIMAKEVATFLGEDHKRVIDELKYRESLLDKQISAESQRIVNDLVYDVKRGINPVNAISIAYNRVKTLTNDNVDIEQTYKFDLEEVYKKLKEKKDIGGFNLGSWKLLQDKLDGFTKDGMLALVGAEAHHGKTSFLRYLSYLLVTSNKDVTVLYFSLEDNKFKMLPAFVAIDQQLKLRDVLNPMNRLQNYELEKFKVGWEHVVSFYKERRLFVLDAQYGSTFRSMENIIEEISHKYPRRHIVVIIDHFYKISDNSHMKLRERYVQNIERLQLMATIYNIPIFSVVELNKLFAGTRPDISHITETGRMSYEADIIMLLYNEIVSMRNKYQNIELKWQSTENDTLLFKPILEVTIAKNKLSGWTGNLYYKYDNERNLFTELNRSDVDMIISGKTEDSEYSNNTMESKKANVKINLNGSNNTKKVSSLLFGNGEE